MPRKKVPIHIVKRVLYLYVRGFSLGQISKSVDISKTAAFNIVNDMDKPAMHYQLCHVLTVNLKKSGIDVPHYAELLRAEKQLIKLGVDQKAATKIIVRLVGACFRLDVELPELVSFLKRFNEFAEEYKGMSRKEIREAMNSKIGFYFYLRYEISKGFERLQELRREEERLLERDISSDTRVRERIKILQSKLVEAQDRNGDLEEELEMRKAKNLESVETSPVSTSKLKDITGISLTREELLKKAYEIVKYPHRYPDLFIKEIKEEEFSDDTSDHKLDVPCLI